MGGTAPTVGRFPAFRIPLEILAVPRLDMEVKRSNLGIELIPVRSVGHDTRVDFEQFLLEPSGNLRKLGR